MAPDPVALEPARSRRSLLRLGIAGLAGLALGAVGRPSRAEAAADPIIMGAVNDAGASNTTLTTSSTGTAFQVNQNGAGTALRGVAGNGIAGFFTSASGSGVSGVVANNTKYGVYGANDSATHGTGAAIRAAGKQNDGLIATTALTSAVAIRAENTDPTIGGGAGTAIRALAGGAAAATISGYGLVPAAIECSGANGLVGVAVPNTNWGTGVYGVSSCPSGTGVFGSIFAANSNAAAVWGTTNGGPGFGVYSAGPAHVAGNLGVTGNVSIVGTVSKGGGSFKIDHPLDPANKYLYHSFVESPDMKNVYDGVVTLDAKGEATVELPDWFEALNRDLRYQLTPMDGAAPNLHVKARVRAGRFAIGGGVPGQEVCWLLTGIRQDAFANAHRIPVEEPKTDAERGLYLHPVEHGKGRDKSVDAAWQAARPRGANGPGKHR